LELIKELYYVARPNKSQDICFIVCCVIQFYLETVDKDTFTEDQAQI